MSRRGIERTGDRLFETNDILAFWAHYSLDKTFNDPEGWELQNQLTTAALIAMSALERDDCIGVHYRTDAPALDNTSEEERQARSRYRVCVSRFEAGTRLRREALPV